MEYNFREIEQKWQKNWMEMNTYKVTEDENRKKFYVLNMFPYPSGAGLHVGHPLGYIASDIFARYKRLQGFNVLNPMGYDAYGLPAEQYAIQTGQHPAITTVNNIARYRQQLDKIGFCFDWDREVRTCDPGYYHWTQWAFEKMFNSYYSNTLQKAQPISKLIEHFEDNGTLGMDVACSEELVFSARDWKSMNEHEQQKTLMNYRIAYLGETMVNWCAGLGTVLANDEVVEGVSVRGGYPVVQKKMRQWCLRVSAYAQRLLDGLETVDWTDSMKETQLDRPFGRNRSPVQRQGQQCTLHHLHHPCRHHVWRHLYGACSRERICGPGDHPRAAGRGRGVSRLCEEAHRTGAYVRPQGHWRVYRFVCHQPIDRRRSAHLGF